MKCKGFIQADLNQATPSTLKASQSCGECCDLHNARLYSDESAGAYVHSITVLICNLSILAQASQAGSVDSCSWHS